MKRLSFSSAALLISLLTYAHAAASPVDFLFAGRVTFSRDDAGWFGGALPENSVFSGRIRYETTQVSGEDGQDDPSFHQYQFQPNPIDPPAMSLTDASGHVFSSATEFFVNTYNDYGLDTPLPGYPFDELFYTTYGNFRFDRGELSMPHYFAEFSIHFNSSDLSSTTSDGLPLSPPDLTLFPNSFFNIYVFGSGLAVYQGEITSVTPVPEPGTGSLILAGACLWFCRQRRIRK